MSFFRTIAAALSLLLVQALAANLSSAQELRRYQPATPTVSPYTNLGRFNAGGLPNYYALVRPIRQQSRVNLQTQRLQRQHSLALQQLARPSVVPQVATSSLQLPTKATGVSSQYFTPGSRTIYRDTLLFYPPVNSRR